MRVLVTYGSKRGGTKGLAEAVADGIRDAGHAVDLRPAAEIDGLAGWDAVVVGGALYAWRWQRDARKFVRHHATQLRELPVWFFSSGPLDQSAGQREIPPVGSVARSMNKVEARAHRTFGGRMTDESQRQLPQGDWRDFEVAADWGRQIGDALADFPPREEPLPELESRQQRSARRLAETLCMFTGITAIGGGAALVFSPGGSLDMPRSMLEGTPFASFLVPGLLLLFAVGVPNLWAGIRMLRRRTFGDLFVVGAGGALTIWIVVQMVMLQTIHWLQILYLGVGLATMGAALYAWWDAHAGEMRRGGAPRRTGTGRA